MFNTGKICRALRDAGLFLMGLSILAMGQGCARADAAAQTQALPRREPVPAAKTRQSGKPPKRTDAAEDADDRHPSRWRRKLKAYYALGRADPRDEAMRILIS